MALRRRELMVSAAACVLVFGLHRLFVADDVEKAAERWLAEALAEAKAANCPCVAIVLPEDRDERDMLRWLIEGDLRRPDLAPEREAFLVEAVHVVVPGGLVDAKGGETLVLLDADGTRVTGSTAAFGWMRLDSFTPSLHAPERLKRRAQMTVTPDLLKLIREALGADERKSETAIRCLAEQFPTGAAVVVEAWQNQGDEALKSRLARVFHTALQLRRGDEGPAFERPLPFGTRWKSGAAPDSCSGCGMMYLFPRGRDLLEFLADAKADAK
jgi:hypothetical protein